MLPLNSRNGVRRGQVFAADLRAFEFAVRVLRQGHPEAVLVRTRSHVVHVSVVRIGDPVSRHRVVRRHQHVFRLLTSRSGRLALRSGLSRPRRDWLARRAWTCGTWSGSPGCARTRCRARAVFKEEAVTDRCCRSRCSQRARNSCRARSRNGCRCRGSRRS